MHETSAKSIVAEATCNSEKTRASFEIQAWEFAQAKAVVAEKAQAATTSMEQHGRILDSLRSSLILEVKACMNLSSVISLYDEVQHRVLGISSDLAERSCADNRLQSDF